jgi:hypothetical protein
MKNFNQNFIRNWIERYIRSPNEFLHSVAEHTFFKAALSTLLLNRLRILITFRNKSNFIYLLDFTFSSFWNFQLEIAMKIQISREEWAKMDWIENLLMELYLSFGRWKSMIWLNEKFLIKLILLYLMQFSVSQSTVKSR